MIVYYGPGLIGLPSIREEMVSVKDGSTLNNLNEKGENHILIVEDNVRVYGPAKPLYRNQGAVMNTDGSVEPSDTEENTFIIMK